MKYLFKGNNDKELIVVNEQLERIKAKLTPIEFALLKHNIKIELESEIKTKKSWFQKK